MARAAGLNVSDPPPPPKPHVVIIKMFKCSECAFFSPRPEPVEGHIVNQHTPKDDA